MSQSSLPLYERPRAQDLIYDWNRVDLPPPARRIEVEDETLRDGLQSPSVSNPSIEDKLKLLHLMVKLGIDSANLGLPASGAGNQEDLRRLVQEVADQRLPIRPIAAARTLESDIQPIVDISQATGIPIQVGAFALSSPIRLLTEGWTLDHLLRLTEKAVTFCRRHDLPVLFVAEDTTRAHPEHLRKLFLTAVRAGAQRVCVADTVGHATPSGARALVRFVRQVVDGTGENVKIEWHGHRDRNLSVANSLAAIEAGADCVHGTALGIGERVGNTPMDMLLVNLYLLNWSDRSLASLSDYCHLASKALGVPLRHDYPGLGGDAHRTATGVHADAIVKAEQKGDTYLADLVYSGVPAALVGGKQRIEVGPMSGEANVEACLRSRGITPDKELMKGLLEKAKESRAVLADEDIDAFLAEFQSIDRRNEP